MHKIIIPVAAVLAFSMILLAVPVQQASTTHTATIPNVIDYIVDVLGIPTNGETISSMVFSLDGEYKLSIDVTSSAPRTDTNDPLVFYITVSHHGAKKTLSDSDITLSEVEDTANLITTPASPTEIGTSDVFKVSLTPSASWEAGDTYAVAISATDPSDTDFKGYTITSFTVGRQPALDYDTVVEPSNLQGVTVTSQNGASWGSAVTVIDLPAGTRANIVGLFVENLDTELRKYMIQVGYDESGTFNPVYEGIVELRETSGTIVDDTAYIPIPAPGKSVPADSVVQVRIQTTSPNQSPYAQVKAWIQMVKITV